MNKLIILFCFLALLGCSEQNPVMCVVDMWQWIGLIEPERPLAHHFGVLFELDSVVVHETTTIDTTANIRFEYNTPGLHTMRCGIIAYNEYNEAETDSAGNEIIVWGESTVVFIKFLGASDGWVWKRSAEGGVKK